MEEWRIIENSSYAVSDLGQVKNINTGKILKQFNKHGKKKYYDSKNDYKKVLITINNKKTSYSVHRLVAKAFIPNPLNLPQINHKNGIKNCNTVDNLEWISNYDNTQHYHKVLKKEKNNGK